MQSRPELTPRGSTHQIHHTHETNPMRLTMQCTKWNNPTPFKGGGKRQSYAPSKTRINPQVVYVYVPNESGVLELAKRVRPKAK